MQDKSKLEKYLEENKISITPGHIPESCSEDFLIELIEVISALGRSSIGSEDKK